MHGFFLIPTAYHLLTKFNTLYHVKKTMKVILVIDGEEEAIYEDCDFRKLDLYDTDPKTLDIHTEIGEKEKFLIYKEKENQEVNEGLITYVKTMTARISSAQ